ncbi:hypothetical protein [Kitasatospora paranensis]|uniref:Knr4/Smi1-like domain-containing protein n=1 Tax=Kitasatospora paranensis TaxID=258053 RepID=A0ABW2G3L7_9ACTN
MDGFADWQCRADELETGVDVHIDRLLEIMDPQAGAGDRFDWDEVGRALGFGLPDDYIEFMNAYGAGGIEDYLDIFSPISLGDLGGPYTCILSELGTAASVYMEEAGSRAGGGGNLELIQWGGDFDGNMYCWILMEAGDPWPVAVFNRSAVRWEFYSCGMLDFLVGGISGSLIGARQVLGPIWDNPAPRFFNWKEDLRLRASGVNPWTGGESYTF